MEGRMKAPAVWYRLRITDFLERERRWDGAWVYVTAGGRTVGAVAYNNDDDRYDVYVMPPGESGDGRRRGSHCDRSSARRELEDWWQGIGGGRL